jgi:hypothetical protein
MFDSYNLHLAYTFSPFTNSCQKWIQTLFSTCPYYLQKDLAANHIQLVLFVRHDRLLCRERLATNGRHVRCPSARVALQLQEGVAKKYGKTAYTLNRAGSMDPLYVVRLYSKNYQAKLEDVHNINPCPLRLTTLKFYQSRLVGLNLEWKLSRPYKTDKPKEVQNYIVLDRIQLQKFFPQPLRSHAFRAREVPHPAHVHRASLPCHTYGLARQPWS